MSDLIESSELKVIGKIVDASNATLLCELSDHSKVIYKPIAGERPLWDFETGNLAFREIAAYYVSEFGGFNLVPRTILRDGPYGPGAVQKWIDVDENIDQVTLAQSSNSLIRLMTLFDAIINNTDRKFGHLLAVSENEIYGIDHGVTFHAEFKLRTVLWQFAGKPLTVHEVELLKNLLIKLDSIYLATLLSEEEISAFLERVQNLIKTKIFPEPPTQWPAVPWPPF